jgi:transposase
MTAVSSLTIEQLQQENARLLALVTQHESVIETLKHQLQLFRHARFGRKSEKYVAPEQLCLQFDEAIVTPDLPESQEEPWDTKTETITYTRNKKGTGRKALPKSLPYVEQIHDLKEDEKQCACGCQLIQIGEEVTEQLDVVPQMTFRVVHIRKKYACKTCEETIRLANLPKQPIDKSIAAPGLLAAVIDSKFNRHMPLYRQEAMFDEAGLSLTRGTLGNWLVKSANLLEPLVKLMTADIQDYDIAFADETPLQVLKEKDRLPTQKSTMWLFGGGPPEKRAFVYQYHTSRSQQVAMDFFADFKGWLHADCYKAYVTIGALPHIQHVACWAHARRYFTDVIKSVKKEGLAHKVLGLIGKLYTLERTLKDNQATPVQVFMQRAQSARPILMQLFQLLADAQTKIPPKSPLAKAVFYTLGHWDSLNNYLCDGRLEIDNNRSERAIKPFVIGRKNWLFHGSEAGAHAGSILYSLIETCKHHKVDVFSWLKYTLAIIPNANTMQQIENLLPYNIDQALLDDMRSLPSFAAVG